MLRIAAWAASTFSAASAGVVIVVLYPCEAGGPFLARDAGGPHRTAVREAPASPRCIRFPLAEPFPAPPDHHPEAFGDRERNRRTAFRQCFPQRRAQLGGQPRPGPGRV